MTKNLIRATYSLIAALALTIVLASPAPAPVAPAGTYGTFNPEARLDTTQVVDPGQCTLRYLALEDGSVWTYCEEDPTNVQPKID